MLHQINKTSSVQFGIIGNFFFQIFSQHIKFTKSWCNIDNSALNKNKVIFKALRLGIFRVVLNWLTLQIPNMKVGWFYVCKILLWTSAHKKLHCIIIMFTLNLLSLLEGTHHEHAMHQKSLSTEFSQLAQHREYPYSVN